jgi:hypothetical protein
MIFIRQVVDQDDWAELGELRAAYRQRLDGRTDGELLALSDERTPAVA